MIGGVENLISTQWLPQAFCDTSRLDGSALQKRCRGVKIAAAVPWK